MVCANPSQSTRVEVMTVEDPRNSVMPPYKLPTGAEPFMGVIVSVIVAWGLISWFRITEMVADLMGQFGL